MKRFIKKILPENLITILSRFKNGNFSYFFWLFPIKKNKIVICNFCGNGYGDSLKYIAEDIINQNLDYDLVWLVKKKLYETVKFPSQVRSIKYNSIRGLYELATAKVWIDNTRKFFYPPKRKSQFYIQTWHGLGMKNIEREAEDKLPKQYISYAKSDAKMTDLMISNSKHITNLYKNSFWYKGDILECGFPRNDILLQNSFTLHESIKNKLNLDSEKKVLLYAPTFRNKTDVQSYLFDFEEVRKVLNEKLGGEWVILFRLHPNITELSSKIDYSNLLINTSKYDDIQELLLISDALITDFSSCLTDYYLLKRPIFLFCSNYIDYFEERGFSIDLKTLGFPIAENDDQLIKNIKNFNLTEFENLIEANYKRLEFTFNKYASKDVVSIIKSKID